MMKTQFPYKTKREEDGLPIDVVRSASHRPIREFRRRIRSIGTEGTEGADGSSGILAKNVLEIHDGRHTAPRSLSYQGRRRQLLMLDHIGSGTVREWLTGLPGMVRDIFVDEVDIAGRREGVRVLSINIVALGYLPVRGDAILEIIPPVFNVLGRLAVFVLQGAVTAAGIVRRTGLLAGSVAPIRVLQSGISGCRMAATVTAVAAYLLDVHLLVSIAVVVLVRRIRHGLRKKIV